MRMQAARKPEKRATPCVPAILSRGRRRRHGFPGSIPTLAGRESKPIHRAEHTGVKHHFLASVGVFLVLVGFAKAARVAEPWADPKLDVRDGLRMWLDASRQPAAAEAMKASVP